MAKCNLPMEERETILRTPGFWDHREDELETCRNYFKNYLFVETDGKEKRYTCSFCGRTTFADKNINSDLFRLRHNDYAICNGCGERQQVKNIGKLRSGESLYQKAAVSFVNVLPDGAVTMESGISFYEYKCDYAIQWLEQTANPRMEITFLGKRRYYFRPGAVMAWKRNIGDYFFRVMFGEAGDWEPMASITEPFKSNYYYYGFDSYSYFIGLEKLSESALRYSAIDKYYEDYHNRDIFETVNPLKLVPQYMAEYALCPQIEMAVKLGMSEAVGELVRDKKKNRADINWKAKTSAGFAKLTHQEAKEFYKNPSLDFLKWYHSARKSETVKNIYEAEEIVSKIGIPNEKAMEACKKRGISILTASKRLKTNAELMLWADYVEMADDLGYDITNMNDLFPKNLQERHDDAAKNLKIKENAKKEREYMLRRKKLEKKYAYTADGLSIIVPSGIEDIVLEGKTLRICVAGYANRHMDGATTILFLRRERRPERSFICIEVNERGKIQQIHGYKNEYYPHAVRPEIKYAGWLENWQKWVKAGSHRDKNGKPIINTREAISA